LQECEEELRKVETIMETSFSRSSRDEDEDKTARSLEAEKTDTSNSVAECKIEADATGAAPVEGELILDPVSIDVSNQGPVSHSSHGSRSSPPQEQSQSEKRR
jgi:hypothetical protein